MAASSRAPLGMELVWDRHWLQAQNAENGCYWSATLHALHKTPAVVWANLRAMLICKCMLSIDNLPCRSVHSSRAMFSLRSHFLSVSLWDERKERENKAFSRHSLFPPSELICELTLKAVFPTSAQHICNMYGSTVVMCLTKHHFMKTNREVEVQLHASASRSGLFTSEETNRCPLNRGLGGPQNRSGHGGEENRHSLY